MSEFRDHADFYLNGPFSPYVTEHRSEGRSPVHMLRAAQPAGDFSDPPNSDLVLVQIERDIERASTDFGAGRWTGKPRFRDLQLQPANSTTEILVDGPHEISIFVLPMNFVSTAYEELMPNFDWDFGPLHAAPFRSPEVSMLCQKLWNEASAGHGLGALFAENTAQTLILELLKKAGIAGADGERVTPLDNSALMRIDDLLDSQTIADCSLADLANEAGYSVFHFSRAFKAATGQSPHQYLIERRLARARDLLEYSKDSIADIAYACGFSSQSHMTTTFSKQLGITPAKYRKEKRK